MSAPREIELKYALEGAADFAALLSLSPAGEKSGPEEQVNHYFDTPGGLLRARRILLRARRGAASCLTLKVGSEVRPGCFDSLELESELSAAEVEHLVAEPERFYDIPSPARDELVRRLGHVPLTYLGKLANERHRRRLGPFVLELDRSAFPDGTRSYELEVELPSADAAVSADARLRAELECRGVRFRAERLTKLERFLRWRAGK